MRTFSHIDLARRGGQDMKLDCTCAPAALDAWRLRSRRPAAAMIACSLKEIKKPTNKTKSMCLSCKITNRASPSPALLPPAPRTSPAPLRLASVLARLVTKGVTQQRSQNETGPRSTLLPVLCCLIPRTYIEPFWIALTPKEKRHNEVCLERVFHKACRCRARAAR